MQSNQIKQQTEFHSKPRPQSSNTNLKVKQQIKQPGQTISTKTVFMNILKQDSDDGDESIFSVIKGFQKSCTKGKQTLELHKIKNLQNIESAETIVQNVQSTTKVIKELNFKSMEQNSYKIIFQSAIINGRQKFFNKLKNIFICEKHSLFLQAQIKPQLINKMTYISQVRKQESILKSYGLHKEEQSVKVIQQQQKEMEIIFGDGDFLQYIGFIKWQKNAKNTFFVNTTLKQPSTLILDMMNSGLRHLKLQSYLE